MRLEVRCCCNPGLVLGWLTANPGASYVTFPLRVPYSINARIESVQLEVARVSLGAGQASYPAFKSGHHSIETLRRIPGFEENTYRG